MTSIYYLFSVCDTHFTNLSLAFQKENMFDHFYGLAYAKTAVLKNKIYNHISYIPDVIKNVSHPVDYPFLLEIEKKYNITIADLIHADRHLVRHDKQRRLQIAEALIKLIIQELLEYKINVVYSESIADFASYFTSVYCTHHQIKFIHPITPGFSDGLFLTNRLDAGPIALEKKMQATEKAIHEGRLDTTALQNKLKIYQETRQQPSYAVPSSKLAQANPDMFYKVINFREIKASLKYLVNFYKNKEGFHYERHPLLLPFYRAKKIINKRRYQILLEKTGVRLNKIKELNFFVYPLHFHPEAATLIRGRWFNDQQNLIEMISKNLPANVFLVVKEHTVCVGRREIEFYRRIVSYHNVLLVNEGVSIYDLIAASKGIITISSSMGLETLLLKKPIISFGDRYYNVTKNVYCVRDYTNIRSIILQALKHDFDDINNLAFFSVIQDSMIKTPLYTPTTCSQETVQQLVHDIYKAIADA